MPIDTAAERAVILERLYDGRQFDEHMALQIQVTLARTQTLALLEILDELRAIRLAIANPPRVVDPKPSERGMCKCIPSMRQLRSSPAGRFCATCGGDL